MVSLQKAIDILQIPDLALPAFPKKSRVAERVSKAVEEVKEESGEVKLYLVERYISSINIFY